MKGYHSVVKFVRSSWMNAKGKPSSLRLKNPYIVGQGYDGLEFTITWQPGMEYSEEIIEENGFLGKRIRIKKN